LVRAWISCRVRESGCASISLMEGVPMPRVPSIVLALFVAGSVAALLSAQAPTPVTAPAGQVDFARDIQPILEKTCANCHSATLKLSELDLSSRDAAIKGGAHGTALVPGSAERSKLYTGVAGP